VEKVFNYFNDIDNALIEEQFSHQSSYMTRR
jgi:hypothetical protein